MLIRDATSADFDVIWPIFQAIVSRGDTYAYATDTSKSDAYQLWMEEPERAFVCELDSEVLGTYYLKTNHAGPGNHVCNCGYMVAAAARGKGLATTMCEHSQRIAIEMGYRAMQFNFVASSNEGAVRLWEKLGFEITGTLPLAFFHPQKGLVDAYVMYKWLGAGSGE